MIEARFTQEKWELETVKTSCGIVHRIGPFPWIKHQHNYACLYVDYPGNGAIEAELKANAVLMLNSPGMVRALIRAAYRFRAMQKVKFAKLEYFNQIGHEMAEDLEKVIAEALGVECYHVYDGWRPAGYKDHYIETCIKCGFENEFEKDFT